ncbi:filamentation protein [Pseudocercospora fijiensis CIRAD86]|uniref:Filamentation protein n=1 Tax=Pseudocercospora fijiensis (strain CIRAD86) TaxID=383855 RepID=M3AWN8_PSEFD|nr:filamentation protein [Pseudocercospora fijiensis CIRAD86]EME81877.1 filamentation protein [Pseudocercospora fijiensis CIRAD86]
MSVHRPPKADKAARYLSLLDHALCNAQWDHVPELARKVEKHAPQRKCLTLAARAESHVASASHRPSSEASTSIHGLAELLPRLAEAVSTAQQTYPDDSFIAGTCLAQIYCLQDTPQDALQVLDASPPRAPATKATTATLGWLEVCEVKCSFIRASCLDALERKNEARELYQHAVSHTPGYRSLELRRWTERLLARACMYSVKKMPSPSASDFAEAHRPFRAWGEFWHRAPTHQGATTPSGLEIPRRQVWKAYYDLLSSVLQHALIYGPEQKGSAIEFLPLTSSLLRVESAYESLLLEETKFPKASQANTELEEWADQVVANWRFFTGSDWSDADLGKGGKQSVSRAVLDILYRAATKTFHSTPILRHLFTLHAALGEFDLAMHAFDSYTEIVDKGKARAEKTGKHEIGVDGDDTAILAATEAIKLLCQYGDREQAERANEISAIVQKWLSQKRPSTSTSTLTNGDVTEKSMESTESALQPTTLAAAYRALGVTQARWAHLTYESSTRSSLLAEANNNLRRAQKFEPNNRETAYALAAVLGEMRDINAALQVIRIALDDSVMLNGDAATDEHHERERPLLALWHMLALCLTAQDQFETASQICDAAYSQFGNSEVLFGSTPQGLTVDAEKEPLGPNTRGIVDQMEGFEKESIIQIRMTQIILLELMEGPDAAFDLTDSLLGLYSKLYGNPEHVATQAARPPATSASATTPSRLGGTLRSITGSIRPRSLRSRRSSIDLATSRQRSIASQDDNAPSSPPQRLQPSTNGQTLGPPISITVTNEEGGPAGKSHHRHHLHLPFHGRHKGVASTRSTTSIAEQDENQSPMEKSSPLPATAKAGADGSPEQPLEGIAHQRPPDQWPLPIGHHDQPPVQDLRLPAPHPASASAVSEPRLLPLHERRHQVGVLIKIWLFVGALYIRADSFDDAENAVEHAFKLVEGLEKELAASEDGINARRLFEKGWGGGKSIDDLWADVWSTKAFLSLTRERPFEAIPDYEQALSYSPDHASGIIGLANLLLDQYEEKLPLEEPLHPVNPQASTSGSLIGEAKPSLTRPNTATSTIPSRRASYISDSRPIEPEVEDGHKKRRPEPTPAELNRLAARDRAYMLLSNLTKLGSGWDNSEAWLALARAHELSKEIGKAKEALWWVVELEDRKPLRSWREVLPGGYIL